MVGAGYTGTEFVAQGQRLTRKALRDHRGLRADEVRWLLIDVAPRVLPGLSGRLSRPALRILTERDVEVRLDTSFGEVTGTRVRLTDGTDIPTRTVVWRVGVRPDPLVESLNRPTENGRLVVDRHLAVPGYEGVYAAGDVTDWLTDLIARRQTVRFGMVPRARCQPRGHRPAPRRWPRRMIR